MQPASQPMPVRERRPSAAPDHYLVGAACAAARAHDLIVLAAFCGETCAAFQVVVTEPMLGEIRLQWWRDALANDAAARRSGHPVADALVENPA